MTSTPSSTFARALFVISDEQQARFLTSLPQVSATDDIHWVTASKAAAKGLSGSVTVLASDFAKSSRMRSAVSEASKLIKAADATVVLAGSGALALPFLLAARKSSTQSIFLESPNATRKRIPLRVAKLATTTVVEWEHQLVSHPFATVLGETV